MGLQNSQLLEIEIGICISLLVSQLVGDIVGVSCEKMLCAA